MEHSEEDTKEVNSDNFTQLSDSTFMNANRTMSSHQNVFEGEIRSGVYGIRPCAIKYVRKSEKNIEEARILTKLSSHTHVVSIIQSGVHSDAFEEHVYIVLDKCHKQNLSQYFEFRKGSDLIYDVNVGLDYSKQIIAGMKYVHENLIFHKDLKPSNILLSLDTRTIKLADFGLSQELESTTSKVYCKHQFGTNGFRAPESFGNSWASLKSDIFSLAVVLYFVLSNGKSPFGDDFHLWNHKIRTGKIHISHLTVSNRKATEHLIKSMLNHERYRRPSIWQVANHPCWIGNESECDFDYGYQEEIDDSMTQISKQLTQQTDDETAEIDSTRKLQLEMKKMGYGSNPTPQRRQSSIVIFNFKSKHLERLNITNKTVDKIQEFNDEMKQKDFTSVSLGDHIYVLSKRSMYLLKHSDVTATWKRMPDLIEDHGLYPTAVVALRSNAIIIAGAAGWKFTKSVSKYDAALNHWFKLPDKNLATSELANVATQDYVYCIGGGIEETGISDRVERFSLTSQSWKEVAPMQQARYKAAAVACGQNIFVAGGRNFNDLNSVEKYDPHADQWTIMKPMIECRWSLGFECHLIGGFIYAVGHSKKGIERYDVQKDEWEVVRVPNTFDIRGSVMAVKPGT